MSKFVKGEIAWAVGRGAKKECEIMAVVEQAYGTEYRIDVPSLLCPESKDGYWFAQDQDLRKKKPPEEDEASWEQIEKTTKGWNPTKELVDA